MNLALFIAASGAVSALAMPAAPDRAACLDRITQVREATGQPLLQRGTASPDEPLLIAAVDRRVDSCRVLVMAADTRDIRPEPEAGSGAARFRPMRGDRARR